MSELLESIAADYPEGIYRWADQVFVESTIADQVISRAESAGTAIVGVQEHLIDRTSGEIYPVMDRIADFSALQTDPAQFTRLTHEEGRKALERWSQPPMPESSLLQPGAHGERMVCFVLDDRSPAGN